jgi:iron complex transport system substrate-binding protein
MKYQLQTALAFLIILAAFSGIALGNQNGYDLLSQNFTLKIFGNANMDNTIDEKDITYVENILKGSNAPTGFSDANHDGKLDSQDIDQIKKIINGDDEQLTLIDAANRTVTVKKPIGNVITLGGYDAEMLYMMGEQNKIVGISDWMATKSYYRVCIPTLTKLPTLGKSADIDFEKVISLKPSVVFTWHYYVNETAQQLPNSISVVSFDFFIPDTMREEMAKFGYLFNKKGWEKLYFEEFHDKYIGLIKARTEGLSDDDRPGVYQEWNTKPYNIFPSWGNRQKADLAGGKLLFSEIEINKTVIELNPEDVVSRNPDIIIKDASSLGPYTGFDIDDTQKPKPLWDSVMNRTELAGVSAFKNGKVYVLDNGLGSGPMYPVSAAYLAKMLHPELFKDLDPKAVLQAYLNRLGSDYDAKKHGVFVYPPIES